MTNNDILRSVRYILKLPETKLRDIWKLAGMDVSQETITALLKKENEEGYEECDHRTLGNFLNGLIYFTRGKDPKRPPLELHIPLTNNLILKKLRIAFDLKDTDILEALATTELKITKSELSAFFRKEDHKHYRDCGDQFMRNFMKGLTLKLRPVATQ